MKSVALVCMLPLLALAKPPLPQPLRLPPGLLQTLPVVEKSSYFGDAVRIADCPDPENLPFGTCSNVLFGGPAIYQSHLSGLVEIRFWPPVRGKAHFEIVHPGNLRGENTRMRAPLTYAFPVRENFVFDSLGGVSEGDLDLVTGEVTNFEYKVNFFNSFYNALAAANPRLRGTAFRFPGIYGSSGLVFEQRPDGLLDVTFRGSTFLPLSDNVDGDPVRIPLPMCGPGLRCSTIFGPGTSLHPHIHWSTKEPAGAPCGDRCPDLPPNTLQVYTVNSTHSAVADDFYVNVPALGGNAASARSHLQGQVQVQFGEPSGGTIPVLLSLLPPAGLLAEPPESPLSVLGITLGLFGHDGRLAFPKLTYDFENVLMLDDPLELSVSAVDLETGRFIGNPLFRGFFVQTLLLNILEQNNGAIPPVSFPYRGPASFERGAGGQTVFRFDSDFFLPFADFTWPHPSYERARAFVAGPDSELNPILRIQAVLPASTSRAVLSGSRADVTSQLGDRFSYSYSIPCDARGRNGSFEYTNQAAGDRGGTFRMENLASARCFLQRGAEGEPDTVVFSGFGTWSKDGDRHFAAVQVTGSYVSIQIDGGLTSNANTPTAEAPRP